MTGRHSRGTLFEPQIRPGLRLGLTLIIILMVISSPIFILVNPALAKTSMPLPTVSASPSTPSTIIQSGKDGDFTTQAEGIGQGTASKSGQTITYTVTNAVTVPAGTKIRLEFANINNPLNPSSAYQVTVTTRNAANAIIDIPSQSTAYTIKQIGTNAIADNSITSTKPAESFMKRVTKPDTDSGVGWDPKWNDYYIFDIRTSCR